MRPAKIGEKNAKGRDQSLALAGQRSGQGSQATLKKHPDVPGGRERREGVSHPRKEGRRGRGIRNRCELWRADRTAAPCPPAAIRGSASRDWFEVFVEQTVSLWCRLAPPTGNRGHCISRRQPHRPAPRAHKVPLCPPPLSLPSQVRDSRRFRRIQALPVAPVAPGAPGAPALLVDLSENTYRGAALR